MKAIFSSVRPFASACIVQIGLWMMLASTPVHATDDTNQFLYLTFQLKDGVVTLKNTTVVNGALKPQQASVEAAPLLVNLEHPDGKVAWQLAIDDPSVRHYEYEDPDHPRQLKTTIVPINDVEFVVRAPMTAGVRKVAVHRKTEVSTPAASGVSESHTNLLMRIDLPQEAVK